MVLGGHDQVFHAAFFARAAHSRAAAPSASRCPPASRIRPRNALAVHHPLAPSELGIKPPVDEHAVPRLFHQRIREIRSRTTAALSIYSSVLPKLLQPDPFFSLTTITMPDGGGSQAHTTVPGPPGKSGARSAGAETDPRSRGIRREGKFTYPIIPFYHYGK